MLINDFIDYLEFERKYSLNTVLAYKKDLLSFEGFLEVHCPDVQLNEVKYKEIRAWIVSMVNKTISNRSINRKVASLKAYYKFLQRIEYREDSPLIHHRPLKIESKVQVPFSQNEMKLVLNRFVELNNFVETRNLLIIGLLYGTGMRRAELIDLEMDSIDINSKKIYIVGKGNKERQLPLLPWCVDLIKDYLRLREDIPNVEIVSRLLITEKAKPIYPNLVYKVVHNAFTQQVTGKQVRSPHIIRHTFATHLLDEGADLMSVKELLGHSSLASTQVYVHNSMAKLKRIYSQTHPRIKKT